MGREEGPGTAPATGGGGSAADIELTISDVEKIGRDATALATHADNARTALAAARGEKGAFGSYAPAQQLFAQHQAVVEVFETTLASMSTNLDDFGSTIVQAAHNHAQTDDDVLAALTYVGSTLPATTLKESYDDARKTVTPDLADVTIDDVDAFAQDHPGVSPEAVTALGGTPPADLTASGSGTTGSDEYSFDGSEPQ